MTLSITILCGLLHCQNFFMCFMIFEYLKGNLKNQYIQISLLEFMTSVNGFFTRPMSKVSMSSLMSLCNI